MKEEYARTVTLVTEFSIRISQSFKILIVCPAYLFLWYLISNINEPQHDKTNKMRVRPGKTQIRLCIRPVWLESSLPLRTKGFIMQTAKTLTRRGGCPGCSEASLGTQSLCWFCHVTAQMITNYLLISNTDYLISSKHYARFSQKSILCV